ncbi:hypothetical protein ACET3Z_018178 [Daucus carota]
MNINCEYRDENACYFHPTQVVTGVCHMCLNEKLLVLASKQSHLRSRSLFRNYSFSHDQKRPAVATSLPKLFAISSLLSRFEFRHRKSDHLDFSDASSLEDSFISIKFENNGVGSWEKNPNTVSKVCLEQCNSPSGKHKLASNEGKESTNGTSVVEHVKPRGSALRWGKRIGHIFKWRRRANVVCHVGGRLEGAKGRNSGWIISLTKTRTTE